MKWRCWAMILHRDLGYFFTGVVIIYAISGLAVNHADSWNSSFVESNKAVQLDLPHERAQVTEDHVRAALASIGAADQYESFDFPSSRKIKIYLKEGSVLAKLSDGSGTYETIRPRWFLYYANRLHLNPARWWRLFSDVFAASLLVIAVTGLVIPRGGAGLAGRGKWLVAAGALVPLAAVMVM